MSRISDSAASCSSLRDRPFNVFPRCQSEVCKNRILRIVRCRRATQTSQRYQDTKANHLKSLRHISLEGVDFFQALRTVLSEGETVSHLFRNLIQSIPSVWADTFHQYLFLNSVAIYG